MILPRIHTMHSPVLEQVRQIAADLFDVPVDEIQPATSRDDLSQWDSLQHVNLVIALEQTFDLQFTPEHIEQMLSIELIAMLVGELTPSSGGAPRA